MAVADPLAAVNSSNLEKIESFLNDSAYREALESSANYNTRLCVERRLRMPFLDSQTGVAQNHSALFMSKRQRLPGLHPGQIYSYPRSRWRKKRRQYLSLHSRSFARAADSLLDQEGDLHSISQVENPALQDTDSKDSQLLKDEVAKDWFYDEQDMLEMEGYDEPDADSDFDYEESYSKRRKARKNAAKPRGVDSPNTPRRGKGSGRGRKKANHSYDPMPGDPDKPFGCERTPTRRGRHPNNPNPSNSNAPPLMPPTPPLPTAPGPQIPPPTAPPTLPPNPLPVPVPLPTEDPPMPVLIPEKKIKLVTEILAPEPQKEKAAPSPYCDFCLGDARENKKTGTSEELVSCSDCGRSGKARLDLEKTSNSKKGRKKKTF